MSDTATRSRLAPAEFRPIHYMGNKSRYLDAIDAAIAEVAGPGVAACDLFAGTSVVTRRLAKSRPVISSDVQAYSSVLARAGTRPRAFTAQELSFMLNLARDWQAGVEDELKDLLQVEDQALRVASNDPTAIADIVENGSLMVLGRGADQLRFAKEAAVAALDTDEATITRYYGGVYYSYRQSIAIDAIRLAVRSVSDGERDATAMAALLGVASDLVSTVGSHFAQPVQPRTAGGALKRNWIRPLLRGREALALPAYEEWLAKYAALSPTEFPCEVVQGDYRSTLEGLGSEVGVIYADPPYTRDHYSRFYHVLETIALDDDPGVTKARGSSQPSRGLYREARHQSPFSVRSQVTSAFRELFANANRLDVPIVLSYSPMSAGTKARPETRLMSIDGLTQMASDYFKEVRTVIVESSAHSRFNRASISADALQEAEVLILASN